MNIFPHEQSEAAFFELDRRVLEAAAIARQDYTVMTEVWLGPDEANILFAEINRQIAEGKSAPTEAQINASLYGDLDDLTFRGLTIRRMLENGVRVGTSFSA